MGQETYGSRDTFLLTNHNDKLWTAKIFYQKIVPQIIHLNRWYISSVKLRHSGALQEDRERQLPGSEGGKAAKAGHGRLCWRLPSELPPDASPWHPPPLAVPAGLSLCGRHVWSWLAGVLAWRSHLSIIDFPPVHSFSYLSFLSLSVSLPLSHINSFSYCYYLSLSSPLPLSLISQMFPSFFYLSLYSTSYHHPSLPTSYLGVL